jgi:hypothetical protein
MAGEIEPSGAASDVDPSLHQTQFNIENMSLTMVSRVHSLIDNAIRAAKDDATFQAMNEVAVPFYVDFKYLPYRNIERARELILALAVSENPQDRDAAAVPLSWLLRRECELGTEDVSDQVELMVQLINDPASSEIARMTANDGLVEGWWPPAVAGPIDQAWDWD